MEASQRNSGLLNHVYGHWPTYLLGYGGLTLLIVAVALISAQRGWWSFILMSFAALLVLLYFFGASLWAAHQRYDTRDFERIIDLGQLEPTESFVHVNFGQRRLPVELARRLTRGKVTVLDVYNPGLIESSAIARQRHADRLPPGDPRLVWRECSIDLLPLLDESVRVVSMSECLSFLEQEGDRRQLLSEVFRILQPAGRLIVVERLRNQPNLLTGGPAALRLRPLEYWRELLEGAGFELRRVEAGAGELIHYLRADKPIPYRGRQLPLGLETDLIVVPPPGRRSRERG
jgi:SAM-dependent methyltransferase